MVAAPPQGSLDRVSPAGVDTAAIVVVVVLVLVEVVLELLDVVVLRVRAALVSEPPLEQPATTTTKQSAASAAANVGRSIRWGSGPIRDIVLLSFRVPHEREVSELSDVPDACLRNIGLRNFGLHRPQSPVADLRRNVSAGSLLLL